jgi:hypothetical protein
VAAYTALQLAQVLVFAAVVLYGLVGRRPSVTAFGTALLIGLAVLNLLAPEGGTIPRRSLIGYTIGALFFLLAVVLVHTVR